jgi:hypothetical protein
MYKAHPRAARLNQKVTGPNNKVFWVTRNKHGVGFAKRFKPQFYDPDEEYENYTGKFVTSEGERVIFVSSDRPGKFKFATTDAERQEERKYIAEYKERYKTDAPPAQHFAKIAQRKHKKKGNQQKKQTPPNEAARPAGNGQGKPAGSQQGKPAAAAQPPPAGVTPKESQADTERKLLQKHHIHFDHAMYQKYQKHRVLKLCHTNLVKVAKIMGSQVKFPDSEAMQAYNIQLFAQLVADSAKGGKTRFEQINLAIVDSDWTYLDSVGECLEGRDPVSGNTYSGDARFAPSLSLLYRLLNVQGEADSLHRNPIVSSVSYLRDLFAHSADVIMRLYEKHNNTLLAEEADRKVIAQAASVTHAKAESSVQEAMTKVLRAVKAKPDTHVPSNPDFLKRFCVTWFEQNFQREHVNKWVASRALFELVKSREFPFELFKKCIEVNHDFTRIWLEYKDGG